MGEQVVKDLEWFLNECREVLNGVVNNKELLFSSYYREDIAGAWEDIICKDKERDIKDYFGVIIDKINKEYNDIAEFLRRVGLQGKQLALKIKIFREALENYRRKYGKEAIDALKLLLKIMSTILGSLASVSLEAEAIKEIVDIYEILQA